MKKQKYEYIFWDFDGTIMNSAPGIVESVKYALECMGIHEENEEVLESFVGPPLEERFPEVYGVDEKTTWAIIEKYREHYGAGAMFNCRTYDGIEDALTKLTAAGYKQYITTSKPEFACRKIADVKKISRLFDGIFGASLDGKISKKADVINEAIKSLGISDKGSIVLMGDTKYDAIGASKAGIDCIGVSYGMGSKEDLEENGAVCVLDSPYEIERFFC